MVGTVKACVWRKLFWLVGGYIHGSTPVVGSGCHELRATPGPCPDVTWKNARSNYCCLLWLREGTVMEHVTTFLPGQSRSSTKPEVRFRSLASAFQVKSLPWSLSDASAQQCYLKMQWIGLEWNLKGKSNYVLPQIPSKNSLTMRKREVSLEKHSYDVRESVSKMISASSQDFLCIAHG